MKSTLFYPCIYAVSITFILLLSCNNPRPHNNTQLTLIPVATGLSDVEDRYVYINRNGQPKTPNFSIASAHHNGMAVVRLRQHYQFLNDTGKLFPNTYKDCTIFNEGLAWVTKPNERGFYTIDRECNEVFYKPKLEIVRSFSNGLSAVGAFTNNNELMFGFIDNLGNFQINPQFIDVSYFSDGLCAVKNTDNQWGYIDKDGNLKITYKFKEARPFSHGRAVVNSNRTFRIIGYDGEYISTSLFDEIIPDGNQFLARKGLYWGWFNEFGEDLISPQFKNASLFNNSNLAPVEINKMWGYIDRTGKLVIHPKFEMAYPFNGNLALVRSDGKYGFISPDGVFKISPIYHYVPYDLLLFLTGGSSMFTEITNETKSPKEVVSIWFYALLSEDLGLVKRYTSIESDFFILLVSAQRKWQRRSLDEAEKVGVQTILNTMDIEIIDDRLVRVKFDRSLLNEWDVESEYLYLVKENTGWKVAGDAFLFNQEINDN